MVTRLYSLQDQANEVIQFSTWLSVILFMLWIGKKVGGWGKKVANDILDVATPKEIPVRLPQTSPVTVYCPICGKTLEVPQWDKVSRSDVLRTHLEREHKHHSGNPDKSSSNPAKEYKVHFIGACKVVDGLCHTHGYSVSREVRCPDSELTQEEWEAAWDLVHEAFPEGQHNPWVNGWWPKSRQEAERVIHYYERSMLKAIEKYRQSMYKAVYNYERSGRKAIAKYRDYVMKEYEKGRALQAVT